MGFLFDSASGSSSKNHLHHTSIGQPPSHTQGGTCLKVLISTHADKHISDASIAFQAP